MLDASVSCRDPLCLWSDRQAGLWCTILAVFLILVFWVDMNETF